MPSFDVVSKFDMQELDNAVNMVKRDIANRFDFKGSSSDLELNKNENTIKLQADNDYQIKAISDMLEKRKPCYYCWARIVARYTSILNISYCSYLEIKKVARIGDALG